MFPALWSDSTVIVQIVLWVAVLGFLWMLMIRPQRNRQRALAQLQNEITVGDEVMMSAGIYGTVRSIDEKRVELEIAPGTTITVVRQAVLERVIDKDEPTHEVFDEKSADGVVDDVRHDEES